MGKKDKNKIKNASLNHSEYLSKDIDITSEDITFMPIRPEVVACMPIKEVEDDLRQMGFDPNQTLPKKVRQAIISSQVTTGTLYDKKEPLDLQSRRYIIDRLDVEDQGAPLAVCINDCAIDHGQAHSELAPMCFRLGCAFAELRWRKGVNENSQIPIQGLILGHVFFQLRKQSKT
jgi:hypothetical protein